MGKATARFSANRKESFRMNRRDFIKTLGAASVAGLASPRATAGDGGAYSVSILGDTHYDATERRVFHSKYRPEIPWKARVCEREFARNADMWQSRMPRLVAAAAKSRTDDAAFLLQLGDLIQGDCCDFDLHYRMLVEAAAACRKGFGTLRFVTVCGNHDIREMVTKDGAAAYDAWSGKPRVWQFRQGPDAWVVVDFMRPDPEGIFAALEKAAGARHVFFVTHGPVSPADGWGFYWFLFGEPEWTEQRRRLRRELSRLNAIVLCGHTHHTAFMRWKSREGVLTQFIANSVWTKEEQKDAPCIADDPAKFGDLYVHKHVTDAEDEYDGKYWRCTQKESFALMDEYKDMSIYRRWNTAGHYRLLVSDTVKMLEYPGDALVPAREFVLSASTFRSMSPCRMGRASRVG